MPYWFDGNNLIGQPASAGERDTRRAFLAAISEYARARRTMVSVYFDGDDRELGSRCRCEGASSITWKEFSARLGSALKRPVCKEKKEEPVRIEEWAAYFGLDKNSLE